jgi:hypothetical protein
MILQRQVYNFDHLKFIHGYINPHTTNAAFQFDQLTEAIALIKSLVVTPVNPAGQSKDTKEGE